MNTYPPEYLLHPVPVLAIYGLGTSKESDGSNPIDSSQPPVNKSNALASTLLNILLARQDFSLYDASRYMTNAVIPPPFRVMTVPKDYVLADKATGAPGAHSPLSPQSPGSPLYPDGLMTPDWIKKHLELPSVVVGCYDLWDSHQAPPGSPARPRRETGPLSSHILVDPTEREKDTALAHEINERRKYFQDKGIKFAAVILHKGKHTDGAVIEERCSMIRKQSGLDAKTSFFTLAPGSIHDLQEFVNILYRSLFESALQYYNNLIKRTRKKKSKLSSQFQPSKLQPSSNEPQPLGTLGWSLRYDIKTAVFQEFKQDIDGVTRILENTYTSLADFLAPGTNASSGLSVRSQRWVEARNLADCMNIKICQFYLYQNDPSSALAQLNGHLHMFQSYSSAWGMGEQSFEYWAWLSKQYRIFADVIDLAIQHGFKVPIPSSSPAQGSSPMPDSPSLGNGSSPYLDLNSGCNPGAILQHPGFYYHLAAMCCAERRRRYLEMSKLEASKEKTASSTTPTTMLSSLLKSEQQVDHSSLTIELLTKSYEQFKRYHNGRMTLYLAAEIAGTYYETGKFEMALKFFERIGKTYRKERWYTILTSILRWSLRCAKELESWDRAIECLVELLSDALPMSDSKRTDVQAELLQLLDRQVPNDVPDLPRPVMINMNQINAFVHCGVQFQTATNFVNTPLTFQITLQANATSPPTDHFRFSAMRVLFSDPRYNYYLLDSGDSSSSGDAASLIDCSQNVELYQEQGDYLGWKTKRVNLGLAKKQVKVIQGTVLPDSCEEVKILGVCLDITSSNWSVSLNYTFGEQNNTGQPLPRRKWLQPISDLDGRLKFKLIDGRGELNAVRIMQRPPCVNLSMDYSAPALLDELFPVKVTLTSNESTTIDVALSVEVKNVEGQVDEDSVTFLVDDQTTEMPSHSSAEVPLGQVQPGQAIHKTVYLYGSRISGSRLITLTARYCFVGNVDALAEKTESIRIPFVTPFDTSFEICTHNELPASETDLVLPSTLRSEKRLVIASIRCCSTWDLMIDKLELHQTAIDTNNATLTLLSKLDDFGQQKWQTGHVYNSNYLFEMTLLDSTEDIQSMATGHMTLFWRRQVVVHDQHQPKGPLSKTIIQLPPLTFHPAGLTVMADVPSEIYLGEPLTLTYELNNPTKHVAEYTGSIELSDAFVFSGYKQLKGRILPWTRTRYHYVCYPLLAGKVRLPRLKVVAKQGQGAEKEVPLEMVGKGTVVALDNDLHEKQGLLVEEEGVASAAAANTSPSLLPTYVFVNARRK